MTSLSALGRNRLIGQNAICNKSMFVKGNIVGEFELRGDRFDLFRGSLVIEK